MAASGFEELQAAIGPAYAIERELGRGGMATVYLARDTKHGRRVALKVLHADLAASLGPERFQREITTAAQLQHPHILGVHDSGSTTDGQLWFTMPFVEGESLRDRLRRDRQLPIGDAVRITTEVANALDYAHEQGVVHRDIKPENILLTRRGDALLADFGIARALGSAGGEGSLTQTGLAVGTPQYMSPEQATGERTIDARSDVYALGAVCYEMLTGEPPFVGSSPQAIIARMLSSEAPSARLLRSTIPPALDDVVRRALARAPVDRWPTAHAFADALQQAGTTIALPPATAVRRRPVTTGFTLLGLGFLVGIGALFAWRSHAAGGAVTAAGGASDAAGPIRLAVIPFENMGDSADGYFADGVTDAVRDKLTGLPGIEVIGSASSAQYRRTAKTPQQIGQELGVRYLLVGKVRWDKQAGKESQVQVSPELVDAGSAAQKWAEPFDAPLTHVFQVQGDIAGKVAAALKVALTPAAQQTLAAAPTTNLAAYDAYLRGEALGADRSPVALRRAIVAYRDAVSRDTNFALAWAALSEAYATLEYNSGYTMPGVKDSADRESARALALAPTLPEAYVARAGFLLSEKDNGAAAVTVAATGLAHGQNARLLTVMARAEEGLGHWDSAATHAEEATRVDPRDPATFHRVAEIALWRRRTDEARVAGRHAVALAPDRGGLIEDAMMAALQSGDLDGAHAALRLSPPTADQGAIAAFVGEFWDLGWALDSAHEARLLGIGPDAFGGDSAQWASVLAEQYRYRGDRTRMRSYAEIARRLIAPQIRAQPNDDEARIFYALMLAYAGHAAEALGQTDTVRAHNPAHRNARDDGYTEHQVVRVYIEAGQPERAIDVLQEIMQAPYYLTPAWLRIDPDFDALRGNPRFDKLAAGTAPIA